MVAKALRILPAALEELKSAVAWYMLRSPMAAQRFVDEADRAISLITSHPMQWPAGKYSTRKITLRRFPFAVVYRITNELVEVVAVAHGHRQPGYWKERL